MKQPVKIGILYSRSGSYQLLSEACYAGAMAAISTVNTDPNAAVELLPVVRDPQGITDNYAPLCEAVLREGTARHVVGCVTSSSRKEVIPVLERLGGTLWYACPYEGFEANEHVVYMHACPNQHLVPLFAHVLPRFGANAYLVGSNYIWGWETNRVARDLLGDAGGRVLGERHLPLGDTGVGRMIDEIRAIKPNFVLNNLIGPSSYAFFRAMAALAAEDAAFAPDRCPILSCNLTEIELPAMDGAADGCLSVGPYFGSADAHASLSGSLHAASSFYASAHSAVLVLADLLARKVRQDAAERPGSRSGSLDFADRSVETMLGRITIDPATHHASLPVRIGRARGVHFDIVEDSAKLIAPDPYLSRYDPSAVFRRPHLRVVS